jgi:hypothetical protein
MPKQPPPKPNTGRFIFLATVLVVALLLVGFLTDWKWHWLSWLSLGEPQYETPSVSADYLPPDTTAVLHVNLREMQDSKYVNKELGPVLRLLLAQLAPPDAQQSLGVDVKHDVDWARVAATADESEHPLVMLSGRFDPARFQPSPKGPLRQLNKRGDRYPLYDLRDSGLNATFTLAPAGGLLLLSENPSRVTDALASAGQANPELEDATLAELLKKVDRKQSLWAAASQKKKPVPKLDAAPEHYLRPIFKAADAFYGGITCGEDVQGCAVFRGGQRREGGRAEEVPARPVRQRENAVRRGEVSRPEGRLPAAVALPRHR